jgi:hypothetical protein
LHAHQGFVEPVPKALFCTMKVLFVIAPRDHNDVSALQCAERFPSISCRKQSVTEQDFVCRCDDNVEISVEVPMLKPIIEDDDASAEVLDCMSRPAHPLFINDHNNTAEFRSELRRFISCRICVRTHDAPVADDEDSAAYAFVPTADDCDPAALLREPSGKQLNERRLADSSGRNIPHRNDGNGDSLRFQNPDVKEQIAKRHPCAIEI